MAEEILSVQDLTTTFTVAKPILSLRRRSMNKVYAVNQVNLAIQKGETLGLVGESGSGKSTLGRTILHLTPPSSGTVRLNGRIITRKSADLSFVRQNAQIVFQNPYSSLNPRKTVGEILDVPLRRRGVRTKAERDEEIAALLERVGLQNRHSSQYPHQFSGGQRQRIGIARAIAMYPSFIVADEPVSALDVSIQAQVLNLMKALQEEMKLTYLFVSHDLNVVRFLSDRVAVMYLGRIVEIAPTEELFGHVLHPYSEALLSNSPSFSSQQEKIVLDGPLPSPLHVPSGCPFHTRCHRVKGPECQTTIPLLSEVAPGHSVACHLHSGRVVNA